MSWDKVVWSMFFCNLVCCRRWIGVSFNHYHAWSNRKWWSRSWQISPLISIFRRRSGFYQRGPEVNLEGVQKWRKQSSFFATHEFICQIVIESRVIIFQRQQSIYSTCIHDFWPWFVCVVSYVMSFGSWFVWIVVTFLCHQKEKNRKIKGYTSQQAICLHRNVSRANNVDISWHFLSACLFALKYISIE